MAPHRRLGTTTLTGVNDAVLIPPVERFTRDADVLLGEVALCVHPAAWAVHLPFALPHLRAEPRKWLTPDEGYILSPSMMLVTHAAAVRPSICSHDPGDRIRALGASMVDLASTDDRRLRDKLEEQAIGYATTMLFDIHDQLEEPSLPETWKNTLQRWLTSPLFKFDRASLAASVAPPEEVKAEAMRFGRTLMVWPQLWQYCRQRFA